MTQITIKSAQLIGAGRALAGIGEDLIDEIGLASRRAEPKFRALVLSKASTPYERRLIAEQVRMAVRRGGLRLEAQGGRLRNGLNTADHGGAVEFGANRGKRTTYRRGGKRRAAVTRHTARQMRQFNKSGFVFTPSVKAFVPELKKVLVDAAADAIEDAIRSRR